MPDTQAAFVWACTLDVLARKPGNVSQASPGHGMQAAQFVASAHAAAPALCRPGAPLGERVEAAVQASLLSAGCNTNLGIVLLAAPLVMAAEQATHATAMAAGIQRVLGALTAADTAAVYRAIAAAKPGGLGRVEHADVNAPPTLALLQAMALAAPRDSIAQQYACGFVPLLTQLVPAFACAASPQAAMQRVYLEALALWPDSHIVRKHGAALAHSVMEQAQPWRERARRGEPLDTQPAFAAWDQALKQQGLNPGTSADLAVASALAHGLWAPRATLAALAGMDSAEAALAPSPAPGGGVL